MLEKSYRYGRSRIRKVSNVGTDNPKKKNHDKASLVMTFVPSYVTRHPLVNGISIKGMGGINVAIAYFFWVVVSNLLSRSKTTSDGVCFVEATVTVAHDGLGIRKLQ